jgi:hypothetical protein
MNRVETENNTGKWEVHKIEDWWTKICLKIFLNLKMWLKKQSNMILERETFSRKNYSV